MSTQVITISNRIPAEPYYFYKEFLASCNRRNINPHFLPGPWGGLISKPRNLLTYLEREGAAFDTLIFSDAWDIVFSGDVSEILEKFKTFDKPIVFNCERACWPRADLTDRFPPAPSPYRFLNSGFFVGKTEAVIAMLRGLKMDDIKDDYQKPDGGWYHNNDQDNFQAFYVDNQDKIALDNNALICQSLHLAEPDEFYIKPPRITSRITGNAPSAFHGNGGGKDWLKQIIGWMGL
jgi:hypothetical protein